MAEHNLTAVGFEPTQLALVELESTPLDHSGKLSSPGADAEPAGALRAEPKSRGDAGAALECAAFHAPGMPSPPCARPSGRFDQTSPEPPWAAATSTQGALAIVGNAGVAIVTNRKSAVV